MKLTKRQKIINASIKYFNKNSFGAVTLHEIAQHLKMTRGNLTYHFKTKNDVLKAITQEMWSKINEERTKSRAFPSFKNLHQEVQLYYKFQKKYAFIFLDYHVLNHPIVKEQFRKMTQQTIQDNKGAIAFSIASGNMKPEPFKGAYNNIAFLTWMVSFFWLAQQIIRGTKTEEDGEALIWSMLYPHFTEKGKKAFLAYFGKSYLDKLGEAFNTKIEDYILF